MSNKGTYLKAGQYLNAGDFLVSESNLFFAIMQSDGTISVYRGTGPNDNHGQIWGSSGAPGGYLDCFAIMQDNGQLAVYRGPGPYDNHGNIWASEASDPVVDIPEIIKIEYDLNAVTFLGTNDMSIDSEHIDNTDSSINQSTSMSDSRSTTETSGWSDSLGVKIGVTETVKESVGIPEIVNLELNVALTFEASTTFTWNGSISKQRTWTYNVPVTAPPHTIMDAYVMVHISKISVPYTLTGTALLKSGTKLPITVHGIYSGSNSHSLESKFIEKDTTTGKTTATIHSVNRIGSHIPIPCQK